MATRRAPVPSISRCKNFDIADDLDAGIRAPSTVQCGFGWVSGTPGAEPPGKSSVWQVAVVEVGDGKPAAAPSRRAPSRIVPGEDFGATDDAVPARTRVPDRARPNTRDTLVRECVAPGTLVLPELQRREPDQSEHEGDDPEADDDGRLLPALLLEMMVERRHRKTRLPVSLNDATCTMTDTRLEHEKPADDGEHDLVLGRDRDGAERPAERQRTVSPMKIMRRAAR